MEARGPRVKAVNLRGPQEPVLQVANRPLRVTVIIFLSRNIFMQVTIITAETATDDDQGDGDTPTTKFFSRHRIHKCQASYTEGNTHISNYSSNWQLDRIKKFHSLKREGREISVQTLSSKYDIDERQYFYFVRFWFRSLRLQKLFSDIENNPAFMCLFIQCEYVKHWMTTTNMINQKFGPASVHLFSSWIGLVGNPFAIVKLFLPSKAHHPRNK